MEGINPLNALSGNKMNLVLIGLIGVVVFLLIRNHKEIKKLRAELSTPMIEVAEEGSEMA